MGLWRSQVAGVMLNPCSVTLHAGGSVAPNANFKWGTDKAWELEPYFTTNPKVGHSVGRP